MNKTVFLILFALLLGLTSGYLLRNAQESYHDTAVSNVGIPTPTITKNNCLADECLLNEVEYPVSELPAAVKDAVDQALMDEYKAYATYNAIVGTFGNVRPFIMIARAEQQHIASLHGIYEKYGLDIPENTLLGTISAPGTLQEACAIGVKAEITNVILYKDTLLPTVTNYEDITVVFTNLMNASEQKHLPAFQRCD